MMESRSKKPPLGRPPNVDARALRRDQILAGARACFLRKGFHAASTAEISAEARVSVANLYQYFPAKDDLVRALVEADLASDLSILGMVDAAATLKEGLSESTDALAADPGLRDYCRLRLEILAEASRNPAIAEVVQRADARIVAATARMIAARQEAGEVRAELDPETTARLIMALYDGLIARIATALPGDLGPASDAMILDAFGARPHAN